MSRVLHTRQQAEMSSVLLTPQQAELSSASARFPTFRHFLPILQSFHSSACTCHFPRAPKNFPCVPRRIQHAPCLPPCIFHRFSCTPRHFLRIPQQIPTITPATTITSVTTITPATFLMRVGITCFYRFHGSKISYVP